MSHGAYIILHVVIKKGCIRNNRLVRNLNTVTYIISFDQSNFKISNRGRKMVCTMFDVVILRGNALLTQRRTRNQCKDGITQITSTLSKF